MDKSHDGLREQFRGRMAAIVFFLGGFYSFWIFLTIVRLSFTEGTRITMITAGIFGVLFGLAGFNWWLAWGLWGFRPKPYLYAIALASVLLLLELPDFAIGFINRGTAYLLSRGGLFDLFYLFVWIATLYYLSRKEIRHRYLESDPQPA